MSGQGQTIVVRPRSLRGWLTVLLTFVYLLAGGLHLFCNDAFANPASGTSVSVSIAADNDGTSKSVAPGHHCHSCFSIVMPLPVDAVVPVAIASAALARPPLHRSGAGSWLDTPPPKSRT